MMFIWICIGVFYCKLKRQEYMVNTGTIRKYLLACVLILGVTTFISNAKAATIDWVNWTVIKAGSSDGYASGTSNGVTVNYNGELRGFWPSYPSYTPFSTFSGGSIDNAPLASNGILQLYGGQDSVNTITFNEAVVNPVIAIWSLGRVGVNATFHFDEAPALQSGGPNAEYGGLSISILGNVVAGAEGNGTIQFIGTYKSISWTNPVFEDWYGFTVGSASVAVVPESETYAMLLGGLTVLAFFIRSRQQARLRKVLYLAHRYN